MKLEEQVCSLDLAKRLKELGIKQDTQFYWHHYNGKDYPSYGDPKVCLCKYDEISAFTVAELGEIIPKSLNFNIEFDNYGNWMIHFWINDEDHAIPINNKSLANAMAEMLIYLLEEGLIKND